jgi:hypothetical protein
VTWKRGRGEIDWSKLAHNGNQYDDGSTVVDNQAAQNTASILTIVRPHKNCHGFTLHILLKAVPHQVSASVSIIPSSNVSVYYVHTSVGSNTLCYLQVIFIK